MPEADRRSSAILTLLLVGVAGSAAAKNTMGLILNSAEASPGYTLFAHIHFSTTYLINNDGLLVHSWAGPGPTTGPGYLLEDGNLIRNVILTNERFQTFGGRGGVRRVDWDANLLWDFVYSDSTVHSHHDFAVIPGGNVLMIAWEYKSAAEAIQAGRDPSKLPDGELYPDHIIEVEPVGNDGGNIVWEWHSWDHLVQDVDSTKDNYGVVRHHPELIDINYVAYAGFDADMHHSNAINYNEALDQIVLSVNRFSEFWIIDHSTTTEEAAGHTGGLRGRGGDLLYRWGNPEAYGRGTAVDRNNYRNHDVQWIAPGLPGEGNILFFNNGQGRPEGAYSSVEEIQTTVDSTGNYPFPVTGLPHGPEAPVWVYTATPPESLYGANLSGAQRLPNGNTLINEGPAGTFHEAGEHDALVWKYVNPVNGAGPMQQCTRPLGNQVFRAIRYAPDYAAFEGRDLTPQGPIELPPPGTGIDALSWPPRFALSQNYPNPVHPVTTIPFSLRDPATVRLDVFDVGGRRVTTLVHSSLEAGEHRYSWRVGDLSSGVYLYRLRVGTETATRKMTIVR